VRTRGDPGRRDLPRHDGPRDGPDARAPRARRPRGRPEAVRPGPPDRPDRDRPGHRQRGALPGQRPGELHHRRVPVRRRRLHGARRLGWRRRRQRMIDCDVHVDVPKVDAHFPYLPKPWVEDVKPTVFKGPTETPYPKNAPTSFRPGSRGDDERPPDLETVRAQVLDVAAEGADGHAVELAILNCSYGVDSLHNPESAVAFASAVND